MFSLDAFSPLVAWVSFTPYVAVLLVLGAIGAFFCHARWSATVLLIAGLVLIALIVPRVVAEDGRVPEGARLGILTANLLKGNASPRGLSQLVTATDPDVIALQELTPEMWASLTRPGGIGEEYPYRFAQPQRKRHGIGVLSRVPVKRLRGDPVTFSDFVWPELQLGDWPVAFRTIHPNPPVEPRQTRGWERNLSDLPPSVSSSGMKRIVAGDFNATLDHREFRSLLARGYVDAGRATGNGLTPTWEGEFFRLTIDHVIHDSSIVTALYSVHDLPGSDHNAVYVRLVVPGVEPLAAPSP